MPMANKPICTKSTTTSRPTMGGEDTPSSNTTGSVRESSGRVEGRLILPTRKATLSMDDALGTLSKDFNRGEMRTLDISAAGLESEQGGEEKPSSKSRKSDKDKAVIQLQSEGNDRSSASARARSSSPTKRKPPPTETSSLYQEHLGTLDRNADDRSTDSSSSSIEEDGDLLHRPRSANQEIDMEEELAAASAIAEATRTSIMEDEEKMKRDFALAKKLDMELNAQGEGMPGDFPDTGDSAHAHILANRGVIQGQSTTGRLITAGGLWSGSTERQLERANQKIAILKKKNEDMENIALHWQRQANHENSMHNKIYNQARILDMELRSAAKHINHLEVEVKTSKHELSAVKQQLSDAVNLSEVRGKELKGAQVFLTKADTLSVTDVVQKVNALNEEMFQMAAFLGEVLVYEEYPEGVNRQEARQEAINNYYQRAEIMLGQRLASVLAQESAPEPREPSNPLLVQIVMQIALTQWCAFMGSRWASYTRVEAEQLREGEEQQPKDNVAKQTEQNILLAELYDSIREHEDQAVAGRWRSLTKAHLPFSSSGWDHSLMVGILSVMSVAGWATRAHDEVEQIEKRLSAIFKPLLDLRKATGEDVTSADLEIATIDPGMPFDPAYMEDAYADGRSASKSKKSAPEGVVSTSGLGLKKIVIKRLKSGGIQRQAEILSMPKVVLEKTIKEAMEPPAPTRKKKKTPPQGAEPTQGILGSIMGF